MLSVCSHFKFSYRWLIFMKLYINSYHHSQLTTISNNMAEAQC